MNERIPKAVRSVVGEVIGAHYYSHRRLDNLLWEAGALGDPPDGNCQDKVSKLNALHIGANVQKQFQWT